MTPRLATSRDEQVVLRLVSGLLLELGGEPLTDEASAEAYRTLIADEPSAGFVMLAGPAEAPQAVCTVSFVHALRTGGRYGIIQEMYVEPALRRTGVGGELLGAALVEAARRGCSIVELGTPLQGERQIQFYARSGFASAGERLRWRPER